MEFYLLGDVAAVSNGKPIPLTAQRLAVLAVLLFNVNKLVPRSEIVRLAWGDAAPAKVDDRVVDYVSRLRTAFRAAGEHGVSVRTYNNRHSIEVDPETVDWHRFDKCVNSAQAARDAGEATEAAACMWRGLELWRGAALENLNPMLGPLREQMEERRVYGAELLAEIELARDHADLERVVKVLTDLATKNPGRERLVTLLLRCLHATGRRAEAVDLYQRTFRHLVHDLGLDPTPELKEAHLALLRSHPTGRPAALPSSGPAQLPADTANFTGREAELAVLSDLLSAPTDTTVCVIHGMAGVGKTALALHAAHQLASRFPDGQLYLNLHAFTENVPRVEPAEAVDRLLRALGVDDAKIPAHVEDRAGLYRERLAGKRALILLDNADSPAQVRPLIPAASGCLVLITSRNWLTALDDAHPLFIDTLPQADAVALFGRVVGAQRLAGRRDVVERIASLCGGLPLALRIVAARLRSHPAWRLDQLVDRLANPDIQPSELDDGERSIFSAFSVSYQGLDAEQRRAFRLLGLPPGRDIDTYAAADLINAPLGRTARLLDDLLNAHLVGQQVDGRYALHDLVREFAASRSRTEDSSHDRDAALLGWLDHQVQAAAAAVEVLYPHDQERHPPLPRPASQIASAATLPLAREWLDTEWPNLIAAAAHAAEYGRPEYAWMLDSILYRYMTRNAHYTNGIVLHEHALKAARAEGSRSAEATALGHLGRTRLWLGDYERALADSREALAIHEIDGNTTEQAEMLTDIGTALGRHGRYDKALDYLERALGLDRTHQQSSHEAATLTSLGNVHWFRGDYDNAEQLYQRALRRYADIGDRTGQGVSLLNLGVLYERWGTYRDAIAHCQQALTIFAELNNRAREAEVLVNLGEIHLKTHQYELALVEQSRALAIFREIRQVPGEAVAVIDLAATYEALGRFDECIRHYGDAFRIARRIGDRTLEVEVMNGIGAAMATAQRSAEALSSYRTALALARQLVNPYEQAKALAGIAELTEADEQPYVAHWHWREALRLFSELRVPEHARIKTRVDRFAD